ncbi:MAG TPA: hypothetical protein VMH22_11625 [bacterium]|nr:hypothetical protein [bacterium]
MRSRVLAAVALGVVLMAGVMVAGDYVWHCMLCGSPGTAYYTCPTHGVFTAPAYYTDRHVGPPERPCPQDSVLYSADSAVCSGLAHHRFYAPNWSGYGY